MGNLFSSIIPCSLGAIVLAFMVLTRQKKSVLPLPPGPPKLPIIGNLLNMPSNDEWEEFQRCGKKYDSDIIHLSAAGTSLIILNSVKAANDILDKRSSIYSNRPKFVLVNQVMGWSWLLPLMAYGRAWKERRRFFQRHFHPSNSAMHKPQEIEYVRKMLLQLLQTPESFANHIRHAIGGLLLAIAYGTKVKQQNDSRVIVAEQVSDYITESLTPTSILVDAMPSLVPLLSPFLSRAAFTKSKAEWSDIISRFRDDPFVHVQRLMADGIPQNSMVSRSLEEISTQEDQSSQHDLIKDVAGIVFIAGSSGTIVTLQTFILTMLCFPEAQIKAQEELDRVVGRERLPDFNDEPDLPYLGALLKEVYRWRPGAPLGMPHRLDKDDEYNGYFIPGQSIVIGNAWAMLHDESDYPDPDMFKPERFLKDDGLPDLTVRDPTTIAFGFGRRACPGAHMALSTVWIMAASILSTFDILKPLDDNGNPIEPTMEYNSSPALQPKPFKCRFLPRHDEVEALIRSNIDLS